MTPLHGAAHYGHYQVVEYLVAAGCDCTIKNSHGLTAAETAKTEMMKQLILNPKKQSQKQITLKKRTDGERFTLNQKFMPAFHSNPLWMVGSHWLLSIHDKMTHNSFKRGSDNTRTAIINELKQSGYVGFANELDTLDKNWNNNNNNNNNNNKNIELWNKSLIKMYTEESMLYRTMNLDIACVNKLTKLKYYAIGLHYALEQCSQWIHECYRSVNLPQASIKKFQDAAKSGQYLQLP